MCFICYFIDSRCQPSLILVLQIQAKFLGSFRGFDLYNGAVTIVKLHYGLSLTSPSLTAVHLETRALSLLRKLNNFTAPTNHSSQVGDRRARSDPTEREDDLPTARKGSQSGSKTTQFAYTISHTKVKLCRDSLDSVL